MRLSAILIGLMIGAALSLSCVSAQVKKFEDAPVENQVAHEATALRPAIVIRVPLPITLASSQQIQQSLQKFLIRAPDAARAEDRAVAVLEFGSISDVGEDETHRNGGLHSPCQSPE